MYSVLTNKQNKYQLYASNQPSVKRFLACKRNNLKVYYWPDISTLYSSWTTLTKIVFPNGHPVNFIFTIHSTNGLILPYICGYTYRVFQTKLKCWWTVLRKGSIQISPEWLFICIQNGNISILLWSISMFPLYQTVVDYFIMEYILFLFDTVLKARKRSRYSWRSTTNVIGKCWKVGVVWYLKQTRKWLVRRYTFISCQKYMSIQNGWYLKTEHLRTYLVNMKM